MQLSVRYWGDFTLPHPVAPLSSSLCTSAPFFSLTANTAHVSQPGVQAPRETILTFTDLGPNFQHDSVIVPTQLGCPPCTNPERSGKQGLGKRSRSLVSCSALWSWDQRGLPLHQGLGSDGGWQMGLFSAHGTAMQTTHWELFICFEWGQA